MRSGVLAPLRLADVPLAALRLIREAAELCCDMPIVVLRCMCVVSSDGGGGREERSGRAGRRKARQRKHSPVP